jgi:electron transport complex protein RnfG
MTGIKEFFKLGILLCIVCLISALALSVTYSVTKDRIELQKERDIQQSLPIVLPQASKMSGEKSTSDNIRYFIGFDKDGAVIGYAVNGQVQGYQSVIKFIVGIDTSGTITGLRILEHGETPGLGARILEIKSDETVATCIKHLFSPENETATKTNEPWFTAMFRGKKYNTIKICKTKAGDNEVMAITGATITSAAVLDGVKSTVDQFLATIRR